MDLREFMNFLLQVLTPEFVQNSGATISKHKSGQRELHALLARRSATRSGLTAPTRDGASHQRRKRRRTSGI